MTLKVLTVLDEQNLVVPGFICGLAFCAVAAPANAISIDLVPSRQELTVGDALTLDLTIRDLGNGVEPSISTFDFDLEFSSDILDFTDLTFGDPVLGDLVDMSGTAQEFTDLGVFEAVGFSETDPGALNVFQLSLDTPQEIDAQQPDSFVLASLDFEALAAGTSDFSLAVNALGDSMGDPLTLDSVVSNPVVVSTVVTPTPPTSIPEPALSWLSGLVLLGMVRWSSQKGRKV